MMFQGAGDKQRGSHIMLIIKHTLLAMLKDQKIIPKIMPLGIMLNCAENSSHAELDILLAQ